MPELDLFEILETEEDKKYNTRIEIPQYLPNRNCPKLESLLDLTKYRKLLQHINESNIPEDVKRFLRIGATRHIVFNYSLIADYYAHSSKEIQELMEESALVIIDFEDAIANGYVKLDSTIKQIIQDEK